MERRGGGEGFPSHWPFVAPGGTPTGGGYRRTCGGGPPAWGSYLGKRGIVDPGGWGGGAYEHWDFSEDLFPEYGRGGSF